MNYFIKMARINRSDVIQKAVNDLAISGNEKIPNETLDKVQLTYSLNKKYSSFSLGFGQSTTGVSTATLPLVSPGSETYITGLNLSFIKDAACDIATGNLTLSVVLDQSGVSTNIIRLSVLTLTAQSENVSLSLPYPLKVKNNTNISVTGSFTLGNCRRDYNIIGFTTSGN
jgi:hypothetical protein